MNLFVERLAWQLAYLFAPFVDGCGRHVMQRPRQVMFYAIFFVIVGVVISAIATASGFQSIYLLANGVTTQARIEKASSQRSPVPNAQRRSGGAGSAWETVTRVTYSFSIADGRKITRSFERKGDDSRRLLHASSLQVVYATRWPELNQPSEETFADLGSWFLVALAGIAALLHSTAILRRYRSWRREMSGPDAGPSGAQLKHV